jgi:hypothetical protein
MSGCRNRQDLTFQYPCSVGSPRFARGTVQGFGSPRFARGTVQGFGSPRFARGTLTSAISSRREHTPQAL